MDSKFTEGKGMSNFVEDLDERYWRERKKNRIKKENKTFVCIFLFE